MGKVLSQWCINVQCTLIQRRMSISELAEKIGRSREYTSGIVNGRYYSAPTVKAISDVLNIAETANSLTE